MRINNKGMRKEWARPKNTNSLNIIDCEETEVSIKRLIQKRKGNNLYFRYFCSDFSSLFLLTACVYVYLYICAYVCICICKVGKSVIFLTTGVPK